MAFSGPMMLRNGSGRRRAGGGVCFFLGFSSIFNVSDFSPFPRKEIALPCRGDSQKEEMATKSLLSLRKRGHSVSSIVDFGACAPDRSPWPPRLLPCDLRRYRVLPGWFLG